MLLNLNVLTAREFEDLMDDLYSDEQWQVEFHAGEGPDGGRDLVISRYEEKNGGEKVLVKYVVQCKRYETTVNQSHVQDVSDTITRYGASGYVLAVTSDISEPLMKKFRDLTERGKICKTLRPFQIYDLLSEHQNRFQKYFPDEYTRFVEAKRIIRSEDVLEVIQEKYGKQLEDHEAAEIIHNLSLLGLHSRKELEELIDDVAMNTLINDMTKEHLGREARPFELANFCTKLANLDPEVARAQLLSYIRNTREYLSRLRFRLYFDDYPISSVHFDQVYQHAFDFGTYHTNHKDGKLEVMQSDVFGYGRCMELSATADSEFTVVTLQSQIFRSKRIIAVDFNCQGFLEFYVLLKADDGNLYFVQYINDTGTDDIVQADITYVKIHRPGTNNGPMLRQEMNFAEDLNARVGVEVADFLGLYIGTRESIRVYNVLLL